MTKHFGGLWLPKPVTDAMPRRGFIRKEPTVEHTVWNIWHVDPSTMTMRLGHVLVWHDGSKHCMFHKICSNVSIPYKMFNQILEPRIIYSIPRRWFGATAGRTLNHEFGLKGSNDFLAMLIDVDQSTQIKTEQEKKYNRFIRLLCTVQDQMPEVVHITTAA